MKLWRTLLPLLGWMLLPGCCTLTGPAKVYGHVGGLLTLSCQYDKAYAENTKFWCKQSFIGRICAIELSFAWRKEAARFFIEDDKENHCLNVTMVKLSLEDAGVYQCGIYRPWFASNIQHNVQVIISPDPSLDPEEELTTNEQPDLDPSMGPNGVATSSPDPSTTVTSGRSELSIWIYCIVLLFILLLLAVVVLVVMSRKKKTGSCLPRKKEINLSNRVSVHKTEEAHNEDTIPDHPADAGVLEPCMIVQVHPENNNNSQEKASEKREEVSYATLVLSDQKQQAIYDNIALSGHTLPQPPTQEVIYTKVAIG